MDSLQRLTYCTVEELLDVPLAYDETWVIELPPGTLGARG